MTTALELATEFDPLTMESGRVVDSQSPLTLESPLLSDILSFNFASNLRAFDNTAIAE